MKSENKGIALILTSAIFWGAAGLFVRGLSSFGITEMQIVFLRAVFSIILFAIIIFFFDKTLFKIKLKDIPLFAAIGVLSVTFFNFCYYKTMSLATLSVAAVLMYTAPIFVIIIFAVFFGEKITCKKLFVCFTSFFGCCLVSGVFSAGQKISCFALVFGLLTGFGYGLYTVFGSMLLKRGYRTLTITFYAFCFAALGSLPFLDLPSTLNGAFKNPYSFLLVVGIAFINTVLPYPCYTAGLKYIESGKATLIATIEPVVSTMFGLFVFGEIPSFIGVIGIVLVLGSVSLLNIKTGKFE